MPRSIFTTRHKAAPIRTRISQELFDRIQVIQRQLSARSADAIFPIEQIVEEALQRAAKRAEDELAKSDTPAPTLDEPNN